MGRDGEEKLARKARARKREDRMNLKSHLIFTLYTIYGILLKGEPGTSGAYVYVCCVLYVCRRTCYRPSAGQDEVAERAVTRGSWQRDAELSFSFSGGFSFSCTCVSVPCARLYVR